MLRRSFFVLLTSVLVLGALAPPAMAQQKPIELDPLEAQEAAADILDTYERLFKAYGLDQNPAGKSMQAEIDRARGQVFLASPQELEYMGKAMGNVLVQMRKMARTSSKMLLSDTREGPFQALIEDKSLLLKAHHAFPDGLHSDLPDYPFHQAEDAVANIDETELEDMEDDLEAKEDELEDGSGLSTGEESILCKKRVNSVSGRVNRRSPAELYVELAAINLIRLEEEIADIFCNQDFGINCSVCCLLTTIIRQVAEFFWEHVQLCEGLTDGAEIEATYHNTRAIFEGLDHAHDDLVSIQSDVASIESTIATTIGQVANLSGVIASTENRLSGELASARSSLSSQLTTTKNSLSGQLTTTKNSLSSELASARSSLSGELASARDSLSTQLTAAEQSLGNQLADAEQNLDQAVASAESNLSSQLTDAEGNLSGQLTDAEQNLEARLEAARQTLADQLTDFEALDVQVNIEQTLIANDKVALFQLPQSAGGFLELVRDVVEDAIQRVTQAGEDPGNADKHLDEGDEKYAEGQYKKAYERYSKAYKELVK